MATDNVPKLGQYRVLTDEELAARKRAAEPSSGPLIGGEDSSYLGNLVGSLAGGAARGLASPFKAVDRGLAALAGAEYTDEKASPITRLGQGIEGAVGSVAAPDPERAEDLSSQLAEGLGYTLGLATPLGIAGAAGRGIGAAASAFLGASGTAVEQAEDYDRARQEAGLELDPADQGAALFYGALPGTLEAVPLARAFSRLDKIAGGTLQKAAKDVATGTVEEALQEGVQNTAQNLIASNVVKYDPDRDMFLDTPEAAALGGGVGFILNTVFAGIGLRQRGAGQKAADVANESPIPVDTQAKNQAEKDAASVDPVSGLELQTGELVKANLQLSRLEQMSQTAQGDNKTQIDARIKQIEDYVRDTYLAKNDDGEFAKSPIERQEAQDILDRNVQPEEITIEGEAVAPAPEVAEAEPFPSKKGIRLNKEITDPKAVKKFNKQLEEMTPEEIQIEGLPAELPTSSDLIESEELDAEIEEIALDSTPNLPDRNTFLDAKPSNRVFADALQSIKEQRKLRAETDEAFEKRKQQEIAEAYRQRELQRIEEEQVEETAQDVQPTTTTATDALPQEQTQEAVPPTPAQAGVEEIPNARQEQEATALYGDVQQPETEGQAGRLPPDEGSQEVPQDEEVVTGDDLVFAPVDPEVGEAADVNPTEPTQPEVQKARAAAQVEAEADSVPTATTTASPAASTEKTAEVAEWEQPENWGTTLSSLSKATGRNFGFLPRDTYPGIEKAIDLGIKDHALFDKNTGISIESRIIDRVEKFLRTEYKASAEIMSGFQNMVSTGPTRTTKVEKPNAVKAKKDNVPLVGKGLVGRKDGSPFATMRAAKSARTRANMGDSAEIIQVEGGYAIRPAADTADDMEGTKKATLASTDQGHVFNSAPATTDQDTIVQDEPLTQTIEPETYNAVMALSDKMAKDPRPERFANYIKQNFGSVKAFMNLRNAIAEGTVVPGDTTKVIATPLGEVENTTETNPEAPVTTVVALKEDPVKAAQNQVEQTQGDLDEINRKIENLEKVMASSSNPDKLMNRMDKLVEQRDRIAAGLGVDVEKANGLQALTKEEIDELVRMDNEIDEFMDLPDNTPPSESRKITNQSTLDMARNVIERFKKSIDPAFSKDLEIYFVNQAEDIPDRYKGLQDHYRKKYEEEGRGVIWTPDKGPQVVLIFGRKNATPAEYEWTLFHEVVGHYGLQKIFGNQFTQFLNNVLKNADLASRAYSMRLRWKNIDLTPKSKEDTMYVRNNTYYRQQVKQNDKKFWKNPDARFLPEGTPPITGDIVKVSRSGMRKLMDEYIAELAGQLSSGDFGDVSKQEQGFVKRIVTWFRHMLRKSGFGHIADKSGKRPITDGDLLAVLRASYTNLTKDPVFTEGRKPTKLAQEASEMVDAVITDGAAAGLWTEADARAVIRSIDSREGRIDNSKWQRTIENISDKIRRSVVGKHLSSTGWLPHPSKLAAVMNMAKGSLQKAQDDAGKWFKMTDKLSDHERKIVFDYFTTVDADPNLLPKSIRASTVNMKQNIDELGEELVRIGALRRSTYEKNKGQYLPIRYYKYLEGYHKSGKKLSFRGYLKQRSDLTDAEKQALGKIEDPQFLVSETIGILGRDVALYTMFKNMIKMNQVGSLGWFLGTPKFVQVGDKKMSLDDIDANIDRLKEQLEMGEGVSPLYLNQEGIAEINRQLAQLEDAKLAAEESAREQDAIQAIRNTGIPESEITKDMILQYQSDFKRVDDPQYGPLMNKWIRKELYDEIVDSGAMFDKDHTDFWGKTFGAGGVLERGNILWKQFKVTANPPSWVRNGIGNFILLDIGTNTNTASLIKMMAQVGNDFLYNKSDKYVKWANEYGLFNTTYSAAELNAIQSEAVSKYKILRTKLDKETNSLVNLGKRGFFAMHDYFVKYLEWSREFYGGMEGLFKTVALRDHIETWERQNGRKIESLSEQERQAVITAAVETANKNIFDYSKVPAWMRTMRRMPFVGAPFLTYTFKAIPQSIESLARRPQKFIKYAMFPYAMAQAFMMNNDLDDDDIEEIQRSMPKWMKDKGSMFLLPWKDDNGNWQVMDFGYYLPWAPLHNMVLNATNTFDPLNPAMSSAATVANTLTNLGFLGGPLPAMISGVLTNKDPFMGTEIVRKYGTAEDKTNDFLRYMHDMWMPTFLTSKGVMGRMMDNYGIEASMWNSGREFDAQGRDRETTGQALLRAPGVNVYGLNPQAETLRKVKAYRYERSQIQKARTKIAKDPNISPQQRASKIRELNEQLKVLNTKHREEIQGGRGAER